MPWRCPDSAMRLWQNNRPVDGEKRFAAEGFYSSYIVIRPFGEELQPFPDGVGTFLHQPFRGGGGTANAHETAVFQPGEINLGRSVYHI